MDSGTSYPQEPESGQPAQPESGQPAQPASDQPDSSGSGQDGLKTWLYVVLGVIIVLMVGLFIWLLFGRSGEEAPPPMPEDDSWARIEQAGVLRVGTAADYPPFEYYNEANIIDGFDPAMIRAMGDFLGVDVEITDFAFQGIATALQVGQVDVLVSALSITPERETIADFTNVYYVGEDGILANGDSDIDLVDSADDFKGKRVGVQERTVYHAWAQANLVDTGIIAQDQLYVYAKPEHAVNDLELNRLDLVMMDYIPATIADAAKNVKLVGRSFNQQRFAIAVNEGSDALRYQLNNALTALANNGTMARLYDEYLNLDYEAIPTPEPTDEPDPTATPADCVNAMEFIRDLTYDDQDFTDLPELNPGEKFSKGWRIKNVGTCTWSEEYFLGFLRGDRMGGEDTFFDSNVKPGATYDMYIDLIAPNKGGEYAGWWQTTDEDGNAFGETIWVAIEVVTGEPSEPTKTPAPTETAPVMPTETPLPPTEEPTVAPPPTATEHPASDLIGPKWVLVEYTVPDDDARTLDEPETPIEDIDIFAIFNELNQMGGFGGCNTYSGEYLSDGVQINIEDIISFQVACEDQEGVDEQEALFFQLLELAEEYEVIEPDQEMEMTYTEEDDDGRENEVVILKFEAE